MPHRNTYNPESDTDHRNALLRQRAAHKKRLAVLEEQVATKGKNYVDASVITEIDEIKVSIKQIEVTLTPQIDPVVNQVIKESPDRNYLQFIAGMVSNLLTRQTEHEHKVSNEISTMTSRVESNISSMSKVIHDLSKTVNKLIPIVAALSATMFCIFMLFFLLWLQRVGYIKQRIEPQYYVTPVPGVIENPKP